MDRDILDVLSQYGAKRPFYVGVVAPLKNGDTIPEGCTLNWNGTQLSVPNRITAHAGGGGTTPF